MALSLDDVWDFAKGVFKEVVDVENSKLEIELFKEARAAEDAAARRNAPVGSLALPAGTEKLLIWGGVALVAVLILPRLLK